MPARRPQAVGIGQILVEVDEDRARNVAGLVSRTPCTGLLQVPANIGHANAIAARAEAACQLVYLGQRHTRSVCRRLVF